MNTEQERAAFEWWASDEGESPRATERVGECYKLAQIQSYWIAWQARAALHSPEVQALRKDAERYRWTTALDDNAETLYSIVLSYGGDQEKINERVDAYRPDAGSLAR